MKANCKQNEVEPAASKIELNKPQANLTVLTASKPKK